MHSTNTPVKRPHTPHIAGISNPSGAWVTPAFQLHTSKMDSVPPRPLAALGATVRVPMLRPAATPAAAPAAPAASTTTAPAPTHESCGAGSGVGGTSAPTSTTSTSGQPASGAPGGSAPSLPSTLPAQLLRMGLGLRAEGEEDEEQLPEPQLDAGEDEQQQQQQQGEDGKAGEAHSGVVGQLGEGAGDGACGRGEAVGCEGLQGAGQERVEGVCRTRWFTHLLLDCDGVLVDSEAASCEALRRGILEVGTHAWEAGVGKRVHVGCSLSQTKTGQPCHLVRGRGRREGRIVEAGCLAVHSDASGPGWLSWWCAAGIDSAVTPTLARSLVGPTRSACSQTGMAATAGPCAVHVHPTTYSRQHNVSGRRRQLSQPSHNVEPLRADATPARRSPAPTSRTPSRKTSPRWVVVGMHWFRVRPTVGAEATR